MRGQSPDDLYVALARFGGITTAWMNVRFRGQTGSACRRAKVSRLTHCGHPAALHVAAARLISADFSQNGHLSELFERDLTVAKLPQMPRFVLEALDCRDLTQSPACQRCPLNNTVLE